MLDLYISKLPPGAVEKDMFYCWPLEQKDYWYYINNSAQPRGKHQLNEMVNNTCKEAEINGHYSNHSLRASGVSVLFQSEVPEKIIQDVTGHRSVKALRKSWRKLLATCLLVHLHKILLMKLKGLN